MFCPFRFLTIQVGFEVKGHEAVDKEKVWEVPQEDGGLWGFGLSLGLHFASKKNRYDIDSRINREIPFFFETKWGLFSYKVIPDIVSISYAYASLFLRDGVDSFVMIFPNN